MNPSHFRISIDNPCTENWDTMNPNEIGRFCTSCSKSVVDFTGQTDFQIKNYLIEHKGQEVCGRLTNLQLNRIVITFDQSLLYSTIPFWQKFLMILLVCFGSDILGYDFCFSQEFNQDSLGKQTEMVDSVMAVKTDSMTVNCEEPRMDTPFIQIPEGFLLSPNINYPSTGSVTLIYKETMVVQTLGWMSLNPVEEAIEDQNLPFETEPINQVEEESLKSEIKQQDNTTEALIQPTDRTKPSVPTRNSYIPPIEAILTNEETFKKNTNKS